ncbi:YncE family protein [candidate division WOR-3 bacterium]|nr:YncE family protein [candidate division WOR-3 bacterium]
MYCANWGSSSVTVIDAATNGVVATVAVGLNPSALCHNPLNNKVFSANSGDSTVTVIDGATNEVVTTIAADGFPFDFAHNPIQNRVYVVNFYSSTISVLRDSGGGIAESPRPRTSGSEIEATVARGVLVLPRASLGHGSALLLDSSGRQVLELTVGVNDVSRLAPGVYFIRQSRASARVQAAGKVILNR